VATRIGLAFGGLVASVILAAVLAAGCGGGGEGGEATPVPPELQDQLKRMALQAEDVPSGFTVVDEQFSTNQDVADVTTDPATQLARLQKWGRILGYDVTYEPGGTTEGETIIFSLNSTVSIYENVEGASASFADAANVARTTDWSAFFGGAVDIVVEEQSAPQVADEILWLRVSGKAEVGQQTFAHDVVLLRTGTARGSLQVGSFGTEEGKQLVEKMIRVQGEHMLTAAQ
jgi:hypothetical protein